MAGDIMMILRNLRKSSKLTMKELGDIIGVSESTISLYENSKREPDFNTLKRIAQYFNVTTDYLLENEENINTEKINKKGIEIPVLREVRAGLPIEAVENIIDYEEITEKMASKGEYFALRIKGDSMKPIFIEGDTIIVRKQTVVDNGDIAIVLVNGDEYIVKKLYKKNNGITLIPSNNKYEPMFFSKDEVNNLPVTVIGKVVELRRDF